MAANDYAQSRNSINQGNRIVAFFEDRNDAYKAISELRDRGFTTDQIGLMIGGPQSGDLGENADRAYTRSDATSGRSVEDREGFWDKVKDFFN